MLGLIWESVSLGEGMFCRMEGGCGLTGVKIELGGVWGGKGVGFLGEEMVLIGWEREWY